jgi:hypothetical protein
MSNATASHPTPEVLTAFGLGKLNEAETEVIARHLTVCETCRRLVEGAPADSLVGLVRTAKQATVLPAAGAPGSPSLAGAGFSQLAGQGEPPLAPADLPPELADHPKYQILRVLGRGGMGVVYEAEHRHMGRKVALKVISQSLVDHPEAVERFNREVHAAAQLNHPNIVTAFDAEQAGGLHLLVMEYVEGMSLAQVVEKKGPLPVAYACHFARQAALGLQHAFEQGMVHRDLKPHNLMVTPKGQVKILDFGLARLVVEKKVGPGLTAEDAVMGTPEYLAPEQALDARQADVRADIYSLGCTLYCLLAGQPPFPDGTAMQKVMAHLERQPRPLPEVRADVPAALWAVVDRMLAKDPSQRYQKPVEVAQALMPFIKARAKPTAGGGVAPAPGVSAAGTGTMLGGDTSKLLKLRKDAAEKPPVQETPAKDELLAPFENLRDRAATPKKAKKARAAAQPASVAWYRRPPMLAGAGAAVLALGLLAGIIVKMKTKDGILVVEVSEPDATVLVDGQRVTVAWANGRNQAEIRLRPGAHQVEVRKDGFSVHGDGTVTVEEGGRQVLKVTLEKTPVPPREPDGFVPLFNGTDTNGWVSFPGDKSRWEVKQGILTSGGGRGHLFSAKGDYENFHLRMEARINDGGNSGVYFRSLFRGGFPPGYEAQINATHPDPQKTGSLYGISQVPDQLHKPGEWFTLEVIAEGEHLVIRVNDKKVVDVIAATYRKGHFALQQHDPGTVVEFRKIEIKELAATASLPEPLKPVATEASSFFNGKDLTGWEGLPHYWSVKDGAIVGSTYPDGITYNTFLCSKKKYKDFELSFQVRLRGEWAKANSGVQIRSEITDRAKFIVKGPQADMGQQYWGSLYGEGSGGMMKAADAGLVARVFRWDDFNDYDVKCAGKHVTIKLNGATTIDEDFPNLPDEGIIAWQLHAGPPMEVIFKNIQFKDLRKAGAADGFVPLFNGKDLTGWVVESGDPKTWDVDRGEIIAKGSNWTTQTYLLTEREYSDFTLRLEFALEKGVSSAVALRAVPGETSKSRPGARPFHPIVKLTDSSTFPKEPTGTHHGVRSGATYSLPDHQADLKPAGEWNRLEMEVRGETLRALVNGKSVLDIKLEPSAKEGVILPGLNRVKGRIGLQKHTGTVRFRNIEIKELRPTKAADGK